MRHALPCARLARVRLSPRLPALLLPLMLAACATSATVPPVPAHMTEPQPLVDAHRADPTGEPYYLGYQMGDSGMQGALDDGQYTYVEFAQAPGPDLRCFDDQGNVLACESVGRVVAIAGIHRGILLRQGDKSTYLAPNPRAQAQPPRQLARTADWASHSQARNHVMLKGPLLQALARSNTTAPEAKAARKGQDGRPDVPAHLWQHVSFARDTAQLDPGKPANQRLLAQARHADRIHVDVRLGKGRQGLMAKARLKAVQGLLRSGGIAEDRIRIHTRDGKAGNASGQAAGDDAGTGEVWVLLMKDGAPLDAPSRRAQVERTATLAAITLSAA